MFSFTCFEQFRRITPTPTFVFSCFYLSHDEWTKQIHISEQKTHAIANEVFLLILRVTQSNSCACFFPYLLRMGFPGTMTALPFCVPPHAAITQRNPFPNIAKIGMIFPTNSRVHHTNTPSVSRKIGNTFARMIRATFGHECFRDKKGITSFSV